MKDKYTRSQEEKRKTIELYGTLDIEPIPQEVIDNRVNALKKHVGELLEVDYMKRDDSRITKVLKAIDFWENINAK